MIFFADKVHERSLSTSKRPSKFINKIGSERLFFGTDLPIDGVDTYRCNPKVERSMYQDYFEKLPDLISEDDYENLMWKNAERFFKL